MMFFGRESTRSTQQLADLAALLGLMQVARNTAKNGTYAPTKRIIDARRHPSPRADARIEILVTQRTLGKSSLCDGRGREVW